jgi:hypothetical protein
MWGFCLKYCDNQNKGCTFVSTNKEKDMETQIIYQLFASNYRIAKERNLTPQDLANVNLALLIQLGVPTEQAELIVEEWMNECKIHGLFQNKK